MPMHPFFAILLYLSLCLPGYPGQQRYNCQMCGEKDMLTSCCTEDQCCDSENESEAPREDQSPDKGDCSHNIPADCIPEDCCETIGIEQALVIAPVRLDCPSRTIPFQLTQPQYLDRRTCAQNPSQIFASALPPPTRLGVDFTIQFCSFLL